MQKADKEIKKQQKNADRVSFSFGVTVNTGNYSSIRVDARFDTDVAPTEDYDEAFDRAKMVVIPDVFKTAQSLGKKFKDELPPPAEERWRKPRT
jgi:hypothetical protein